jgi:CDP-6-deoxy-D-xylo-4-hexulose-3-dehydrase
MKREDQLRTEIRERVVELYGLREAGREFIPGSTRINYAGRVFDEKEMIAAVDSALDFWLTLGKKGKEFIDRFTEYMGMKYGLAVNSGSSANLIAVSALCSPNTKNPLQPGDEVITTALAFPTTVNPILQNRLVPVFADIEADTYNIDASVIEDALTERTRAVMLAHTLGNPAEMDKITDIAKSRGLYVIEDTCDALDSRYNGQLCGTFGDISTYSFYAAHHITMGEGGAVLTNNHELYRQALSIRDWGRACFCRTGEEKREGACGHRFDHHIEGLPAGYDHKYVYSNIGYNLKPLDLQCAIGIEQLKKLPRFTSLRKHNFNELFKALEPYRDRLILPRSLPGADPSWFSFPITVRENAGFERSELVSRLESSAIETRMLFTGNILKHPAYRNIRCRLAGSLENTDRVLERTFFLGVYPGMTSEKLEYMISIIKEFMEK